MEYYSTIKRLAGAGRGRGMEGYCSTGTLSIRDDEKVLEIVVKIAQHFKKQLMLPNCILLKWLGVPAVAHRLKT